MDQSELDLNGIDRTETDVYYLNFLKLMKMTYGSLSRSGIRPFNLTLNTTLAYRYEYSGATGFFFFCEYKLKINKWCLHPSYF